MTLRILYVILEDLLQMFYLCPWKCYKAVLFSGFFLFQNMKKVSTKTS